MTGTAARCVIGAGIMKWASVGATAAEALFYAPPADRPRTYQKQR